MSIMETLIDTAKVSLVLVIAVVASIYVTGSPGIGIAILFIGFVAKASMERRQNKKSEKDNSTVKEPQPIQSAIQGLPHDWNKDEFHFVNVIAFNNLNLLYKDAVGYIYATDNW